MTPHTPEQVRREKAIFEDIPPLREETFSEQEQPLDSKRISYATELWHSQDHLLLPRDRQVEKNIRMLAGEHWSMWSEGLGRFVDISELMEEVDERWRQRPVINRLLIWYMLTHARLTENPPILSFLPSTGDRSDAHLAEVYDTIFKSLWHETDMLENHDDMVKWLIPGGRAHLKTRVDPNMGDVLEYRGPAMLELLGPDGAPQMGPDGQPVQRLAEDVPYGPSGNGQGFEPRARLNEDGSDWEATGKAFREHEGGLVVDPLSCVEVRGQWGPQRWHRKRWHMHKTFLTPEEVWDTYRVECEPDLRGEHAERAGELRRLLFGTGYFGATSQERWGTTTPVSGAEGYCEVYELWHAPSRFSGMEQGRDQDEQPGGRLLVVTRQSVLRDGQRPAAFPNVSPIRTFDFVGLPGRPSGTSPQEALNPIQEAYNRGWSQIMEHRNLVANPAGIVDTRSGLSKGMVTNEPGKLYYVQRARDQTPVIEYVQPPQLSEDVWRSQDLLLREIQDLGQMQGAEGRPPTSDASGELVKELRFNADRYIGPTARALVTEYGRMSEDWLAILPTIWDREKTINYAGEDQVVRTVTVTPDLFQQGNINVQAELESMLPEGRGERQVKVERWYDKGLLGEPGSPEARSRYYELARFPHMGRAVRPGGTDRVMAEQNNGKLAQGIPAEKIPVFEWYDLEIHLEVLEEFMKSPEYLRMELQVRQQFVSYRQKILMGLQRQLQVQTMRRARQDVFEGRARVGAAADVASAQAEAQEGLAAEMGGTGPGGQGGAPPGREGERPGMGRSSEPGSRERVAGASGPMPTSTRARR